MLSTIVKRLRRFWARCRDLGIDVPTQLSVAAHGNPEWYEVFPLGITCYASPLEDMGRVAAQLVLDRMDTQDSDHDPPLTRLPGKVELRSSLVPAPPRSRGARRTELNA